METLVLCQVCFFHFLTLILYLDLMFTEYFACCNLTSATCICNPKRVFQPSAWCSLQSELDVRYGFATTQGWLTDEYFWFWMSYSVKLRRLWFYEHVSLTHSFAVPANVKVATCEKQKIYFSSPLLHGQWPLNWFLSFLPLLWHLNHALLLKPVRTFPQMLADISTKGIRVSSVWLWLSSVLETSFYRGERIFAIKQRYLTRTVIKVFFLSSSHCTLVHLYKYSADLRHRCTGKLTFYAWMASNASHLIWIYNALLVWVFCFKVISDVKLWCQTYHSFVRSNVVF